MEYFDIREEKITVEVEKKYENSILIKLFFTILFVSSLFYFQEGYCEPIEIHCPQCQITVGRYFPETWQCSECGYENYVQMRYCGMCGNERS